MMGVGLNLHAQDLQVGYVNTTKVMNKAPQAQAARKKLKNEFAPRDEKIVAMQNELKNQEEELAKNSAILSDTVRSSKERKIISLKRDIKRAKEEFNEDLNIRRNEELARLQKLVYDAIVSLAKEQHYDLIVGDSVLFASKRIDVTKKVLDRLQQEYDSQAGSGTKAR
jgi:outer membrane protein